MRAFETTLPTVRRLLAVAVAGLCAVGTLAAPVAEKASAGLLARWRFDRIVAGVVRDASGNGHDATFFSNGKGPRSPRLVKGIHGNAVALSAKREEGFTVADSADLNMSAPFTVMAWIKPTRGHGSFSIACMKGDRSGRPPWPGWRLRFFWTHATLQVGTPDGKEPQVTSPRWSVPAGFWSHVAATWDGKALRIYVNAVLKGTTPFDGKVARQNPRRPLVLGNYIGRKNAYAFDGSIDDVRIYSRCLSAEQIFEAASSD